MANQQGRATRRGRGLSAGLDRAGIVAAASELEPGTLTMQAVADRLGVDRKALHHHVADRESLLRLMAASTFENHFALSDKASSGWWEDVAAFGRAVYAAASSMGALAESFAFDPAPDQASFVAVEFVLERLLAAGFDDQTAGRVLILITSVAMSSARDMALEGGPSGHPNAPALQRALNDSPNAFSGLRRISRNPELTYDEQFEFDLRVVLRGLREEYS